MTKLIEIPILNFINYNPINAKKELKDKIDFITYENKHYESSFTKFFQGFYLIKKFNFDKRILHFSSDIRNKYYTKEEAIKKIKEPAIHPNEEKDLNEFIKKLDLDENEFNFILKKTKFDTQNYKKTFLIRIIDLLIKIYKYCSNLLHNNNFKNENRSSYYSSISFIDKPKFWRTWDVSKKFD